MTGFLNRNYFCQKCKKGYTNKEQHSCNTPCRLCRHLHEDMTEDWRKCSTCNCSFRHEICFRLHNHKSSMGRSTCDEHFKCTSCNQMINRKLHEKKSHICGEIYCKTCKNFAAADHMCYMQPVEAGDTSSKQKKTNKPMAYICFDLECTQDDL